MMAKCSVEYERVENLARVGQAEWRGEMVVSKKRVVGAQRGEKISAQTVQGGSNAESTYHQTRNLGKHCWGAGVDRVMDPSRTTHPGNPCSKF